MPSKDALKIREKKALNFSVEVRRYGGLTILSLP